MRMTSIFAATLGILLCASTQAVYSQEERNQSEAVQLLCDYVRIDTTNPPGNEKIGAEFLAGVLQKNGIDAQLFETSTGRSCVYGVLKGSGKKRAIVLLNHIDVVPARSIDWKHPPFGGEIHDGEIWGRGTLDMKGMGIIELEAMLMLKRSGVKLDRDIIFLATPDEEVGGVYGAKWFKEHKPDLVKDAEFLLNEGFHIDADEKGNVKYWGVNVAEKSVLWLQLKAKGEAGHASMPIVNSAPNKLVRALSGLIADPPSPLVLPTVRRFFKEASVRETGTAKEAYADIDKALSDPSQKDFVLNDKMKSAMLRNTVSLTVLRSGYKTNVIPGEAVAELDCRLLPGVDHEKFIEDLKQKLNDPTIEVAIMDYEAAQPSSEKTDLFEAIKSVAHEEDADVPVVPVITQWFTDSHWFRELGITSYGWEPVEQDPEHIATVHGKNERVPIKSLNKGVERMHKVLLKLAAPSPSS